MDISAPDQSLEQRLEELLRREQAERHRAEQALAVLRHTDDRFRALWNSNIIGIVEINHERILDANESFLEMTGLSRTAVINGSVPWRELVPAKYMRFAEQAHARVVEEGSFPPFEEEMYRQDGSLVPVWVGGVLLHPPPEWTCIKFILDLSERKILEDQFHVAQKLKSLGVLSSVIAHDFNNLLTAIIGNASLALDELGDDHPANASIREVLQAGRLASGLTSQLVGYSAKPRSKDKTVDLSKLVREIGDLFELPISPNARIEWNLAPGLPQIYGDAYLIQQVLMNLVLNASDAIGENDGRIRILTHCRDYRSADLNIMTMGANLPAGTYVAVEVHDNGCGMPDDVKARIFDALFTTKSKGRGLGLAAALGIIKSHHGAVNVISTVGEGTQFIILFPASLESPSVPDGVQSESNLSGKGTVLIVDDEPSVRRLAEATLRRYGYSVIVASNGKEGVEIFLSQPKNITLIIMDLSMPVLSGEQALEQLTAGGHTPRVLFTSGYNGSESIKNLGDHPFIQKPYTSRELAARVKELHSLVM